MGHSPSLNSRPNRPKGRLRVAWPSMLERGGGGDGSPKAVGLLPLEASRSKGLDTSVDKKRIKENRVCLGKWDSISIRI